jgi:AcrR family transcriptional regulator
MSTDRRGRGPTTRLPRAQRRAHFLDVAAELIVEQGIDAVTMEGVAARAGVSKGLGYAYFDNKEELLVALFEREMAELDRRIAEAVASAEDFEQRIRAMIVVLFEVTTERGVLMGTLQQAKLGDGPLEERRQQRQLVVENFFADMVVEHFGLSRRQAVTASAILLGGVAGALSVWLTRRASRREITEVYVRIVMGALGALAPADARLA